MQVVVKPAPPFVIKSPEGHYSGLAIDLWQTMAEELGLQFHFVGVDNVPDLLNGVAQGRYDLGVGAISITADRLKRVDFTQPYFHSGLGIAVPTQHESSLAGLLHNLLSPNFLKAVGGLVALLLVIGLALWLFERRRNSHMFSNDAKGIGSAFWWAAVTMTTVG
ncbi:MAG: amino acid ABC transporter substrate-binding protein, partial [Gammaproteobacteria bacterium]